MLNNFSVFISLPSSSYNHYFCFPVTPEKSLQITGVIQASKSEGNQTGNSELILGDKYQCDGGLQTNYGFGFKAKKSAKKKPLCKGLFVILS